MGALNPFTERGVIRDPGRFFGRKQELMQILERLAAMQSVSIVGERRIGKSSLLAMIAATGPDTLGSDFEFHYIDLQLVESTEDFITRVLDALDAEGETIRDVERAIENRKVILCLDEFEQARNFSKDFSSGLRGMATTGHMALVTASQRKLADLAGEVTTSPFFNIFTTLWLGEMDSQESEELLNGLARIGGKTFSPEDVTAAYQMTGGSPWKIQIFGYYLFESGNRIEAEKAYRQEMASNITPRARQVGQPASQLPAALLVAAALIGFASIVLNVIVPGMILALALFLLAGLVEGLRSLTRRGATP